MPKTLLQNMVDPQVLSDMISAELPNKLRFTPLADADYTLTGAPGSTVTVPRFEYAGDAKDVAEGQPIELHQLTTSVIEMSIKKAGHGFSISDEAQLSAYGDPIAEIQKQVVMAIANKVDNDLLEVSREGTQKATGSVATLTGLQGALDIFSDEDAERYVLICNPKDAAKLRTEARKEHVGDKAFDALVNGTAFNVLGVEVVRSNKVAEGEGFLYKLTGTSNALRLLMKRNVIVEHDRDIVKGADIITANQHYGVYLYDPTKLVTFGVKPTTTSSRK